MIAEAAFVPVSTAGVPAKIGGEAPLLVPAGVYEAIVRICAAAVPETVFAIALSMIHAPTFGDPPTGTGPSIVVGLPTSSTWSIAEPAVAGACTAPEPVPAPVAKATKATPMAGVTPRGTPRAIQSAAVEVPRRVITYKEPTDKAAPDAITRIGVPELGLEIVASHP